ncbi:uncharacterized protein LOC120334952 [Styela clava]
MNINSFLVLLFIFVIFFGSIQIEAIRATVRRGGVIRKYRNRITTHKASKFNKDLTDLRNQRRNQWKYKLDSDRNKIVHFGRSTKTSPFDTWIIRTNQTPWLN